MLKRKLCIASRSNMFESNSSSTMVTIHVVVIDEMSFNKDE